MGEISKLAWLIELVREAMWAYCWYPLYVLSVSVRTILALLQPVLCPSS
jgi:hypothetical protein